VIDDESLVKTRTNTCLSYTSAVPSYSVSVLSKMALLNTVASSQLLVANIKPQQLIIINFVASCM
jgi:hypothetical protein